MIIKVKQTRYEKKQGTKTVYIPASVKEFDYTEQNYDWFIDASNGFRRAGGGGRKRISRVTRLRVIRLSAISRLTRRKPLKL